MNEKKPVWHCFFPFREGDDGKDRWGLEILRDDKHVLVAYGTTKRCDDRRRSKVVVSGGDALSAAGLTATTSFEIDRLFLFPLGYEGLSLRGSLDAALCNDALRWLEENRESVFAKTTVVARIGVWK